MSTQSSLPIQAKLLLSNNKTLLDIKAEILLSFVLQLFEEYEQLKDDQYSEPKTIVKVKTDNTEDIVIDDIVTPMIDFLRENIIPRSKLFKIFREANQNKQNFLLAKQYEPYGVYFEKLGMLLKQLVPNGSSFLPEYLGLLLIHHYKIESGYQFILFPMIENIPFDKLLPIYDEVNIRVKKELLEKHPNSRIWEHRTVFDTMDKIALKMIVEYNKFQYKLNVNRKSKTRKKR